MSGRGRNRTSGAEDFALSRRAALAGLGATAAVAVAPIGPGAGAEPAGDPWLVLAEEFVTLSAFMRDCPVHGRAYEAVADRCLTRAEAIEEEIAVSRPASPAGALAWLQILTKGEDDFVNLCGSDDTVIGSIAAGSAVQLARLTGAADHAALAPFAAAIGDAVPPKARKPAPDPWLMLADRHVAACRDAQAGWIGGELPDRISSDCWGRCRAAIDGLEDGDAAPGAAGVAAWLRLYSLPEDHDLAPFVPEALPFIAGQAVAIICALSAEAALAVARLEVELGVDGEGGA